jgi:hypothetical protein
MRNPFRSEAEAFRFLVVSLVAAVIIGAASWINTWVGVAAALVVVAGVIWGLWRPSTETEEPSMLMSGTPGTTYRVLLVAPAGASGLTDRIGRLATDVLVVVPALVSTVHALTGDVDHERAAAQRTAETLAGDLSRSGVQARGLVGADDTVLAIEDALREFGADEIVFADAGDGAVAHARERFALPVSTL